MVVQVPREGTSWSRKSWYAPLPYQKNFLKELLLLEKSSLYYFVIYPFVDFTFPKPIISQVQRSTIGTPTTLVVSPILTRQFPPKRQTRRCFSFRDRSDYPSLSFVPPRGSLRKSTDRITDANCPNERRGSELRVLKSLRTRPDL